MAKKNSNIKGARKGKIIEKKTIEKAADPKIFNKNYLISFFQKNRRVIRFLGIYLFYIVLFTGIYILFQDRLTFLSAMTANALSGVLSVFGVDSSSYGQSVYMNGFSVMVIDECTGMYELLVYAGCVLAYPTTLRNKFLGIALGIPAMIVVNMLRLVFLSFVGMLYPALFSYVHYYLWQVTFIFLIVMFILLWIEKIVKNTNN